ncbi:MAG TPA: VOC family protein [Alphaproteobacteria bacterium]|jgi:catechol 2,3-dioxygenase-like lactoylglutathione lyase family enzyme
MPRVQHVAIRSENPEKLAKYYEDVFGWTRLRLGGGGGVHLTDGHINIAILNTNGAPAGVEHIGVKVESMDEVKDGLAKYGVALEARPADNRAAEQRVVDPDGNSIDLSVRGFMYRA